MVANIEPLGSDSDDQKSLHQEVKNDLKVLANFIDIYCKNRHFDRPRQPVSLKGHDVNDLAGRPVQLCDTCVKLILHAFVKRTNCPLSPKPACKHCPDHCYHPRYREAIQEVMRYSGRKLILSGRLDYLFHLLF